MNLQYHHFEHIIGILLCYTASYYKQALELVTTVVMLPKISEQENNYSVSDRHEAAYQYFI